MLSSVFTLFLLSFILSSLLVYAYLKWRIIENPLIQIVDDLLPQANCGACGYAGCRAFAEALASRQSLPGKCSVSAPDVQKKIAHILSVDVGEFEKQVARLACAGGDNVATKHAIYSGIDSCRAASLVGGGANDCAWGCLGFGDCDEVCQFNAISMNAHHLPVVEEAICTACNDCVVICPRELFSLQAISHHLWVRCKNLESGDELLERCEVACTACGRCAHDAEDNLITMVKNLPLIDYSKIELTQNPIERCPTGAIVWLTEDGKIVKGREAKKVVRQSPKEIDYS